MKVIDHQPHHWFLLQDQDTYFFDINGLFGAVGYSLCIKLNAQEIKEYHKEGRNFLDELAEAIHYSAPIQRNSKSSYKDRSLEATDYSKQIYQAIMQWQTQK